MSDLGFKLLMIVSNTFALGVFFGYVWGAYNEAKHHKKD